MNKWYSLVFHVNGIIQQDYKEVHSNLHDKIMKQATESVDTY